MSACLAEFVDVLTEFTGCAAAHLARSHGVQEVGDLNPPAPTGYEIPKQVLFIPVFRQTFLIE